MSGPRHSSQCFAIGGGPGHEKCVCFCHGTLPAARAAAPEPCFCHPGALHCPDAARAAAAPSEPTPGLREALSDAVKRAGVDEIADALVFAFLDGTFADATEEQVRHAVYEAVGRAAAPEPTGLRWLIERGQPTLTPTMWWTGLDDPNGWTADANAAVWFPTRQAAENSNRDHDRLGQVTEHLFFAPEPTGLPAARAAAPEPCFCHPGALHCPDAARAAAAPSEPTPGLREALDKTKTELLAEVLRRCMGIDANDNARHDFGDINGGSLQRPSEVAAELLRVLNDEGLTLAPSRARLDELIADAERELEAGGGTVYEGGWR